MPEFLTSQNAVYVNNYPGMEPFMLKGFEGLRQKSKVVTQYFKRTGVWKLKKSEEQDFPLNSEKTGPHVFL